MTFTHLPQLAGFIRRTHLVFGFRFASEALSILGELNAAITAERSAVVGASYYAITNPDHGSLKTLITITKLPSGAWDYSEMRYEKAQELGLV